MRLAKLLALISAVPWFAGAAAAMAAYTVPNTLTELHDPVSTAQSSGWLGPIGYSHVSFFKSQRWRNHSNAPVMDAVVI